MEWNHVNKIYKQRLSHDFSESFFTRYKLFEHNCNYFVDDVLSALGVEGVGHDALDCGGVRPLMSYFPWTATGAEVLKLINGGSPDTKTLAIDILFPVAIPAANVIDDISRNPHVKAIQKFFSW